MNAAPALLGYVAGVGFLAPRLLLRSAWPHRAPTLALAVWHGLTVSFTIAIALAVHHLAMPTEHLHANVIGALHYCGLATATTVPDPAVVNRLVIALPISVLLLVFACFVFEAFRGRRARSRHRKILDMVGRRSPQLCATVLDHDVPAAYCLPGYKPRVVVSAGAVRLLSPGSSRPYSNTSAPTSRAVTTWHWPPPRRSPVFSAASHSPITPRSRPPCSWR